MKIAHVVSTFPPYQGGTGNVAFYLAKYLSEQGEDVTVLTPRYNQSVIEQSQDKFKFKIEYYKPIIQYGNAAFIPQIWGKLNDFDVVHLHYPFFGGAETIWLKKKFGGKFRLVIQYHNDVLVDGVWGWLFNLHNRFLLPRIITSADKLLVLSQEHGFGSLLAPLLQNKKVAWDILNNGIDERVFFPEAKDSTFLAEYKIKPQEVVFSYVGSLDKAHFFKGIKLLLKSFATLQTSVPTRLLIVGDGNLLEDYKKYAEELNLDERVIFTGGIGHDRLNKFMNLCDCLVLPSEKIESFGIVMCEAMACRKAVIASRLPGVDEVFSDGVEGLYFNPSDVRDLTAKMKQVAEDADSRIKMGKSGFSLVQEKYRWEKIGEKLMNIYQALL